MAEPTWSDYYAANEGRAPRDQLLEVLGRFSRPGNAVDLGCGAGIDTLAMLDRGWQVLAIDAEADAIERLRARAGDEPRLETRVASFADAEWPSADLVNAGYALPFCPPEQFDAVWARVVASVRPGGRFSGQLFGDHDEWAADPELSFQTREQALALLGPFELERFDEEDADGKTALGERKHWHVFHVIARRPAD
jgi:SAM-dependent methyltransferase